MSDVKLRQCAAADAPALAIIGAATVVETFAGVVPGDALLAHCAKNHVPAAYESWVTQPPTRAWLAEVAPGRAPVGYSVVTSPDFPAELLQANDLELRRLYLFSKFHGSGAGRRMMEAAVAYARDQQAGRLLLGVHPDNQRAIAFYKKTGFQQIGMRHFQVGSVQFHDPVFALRL